MRIGVMLRAYDRPGGIGIYSRNIVNHLLTLDRDNHYILLYNNRDHVGTFGHLPNVNEEYVAPSNQIVWDQWHARRVLDRWDVDLVFNTKFSLPLLTGRKRIMVLHGSSWFKHPELYNRFDILYVRSAMPVYCRAADFLISNSDLTTRDFREIYGIPDSRIRTVHLAPGDNFKPVTEPTLLEQASEKYALPERFLLTVTSHDPRKNFSTLLEAFATCRETSDIELVVVGKDCEKYRDDFKLHGTAVDGAIHFPGWIEQDDLPAIYSLATAYVFPSVYEEFGIPVVEAMACGCPVISSTTGAIPELVGDAGLLADPFDAQALADNILKVAGSDALRDDYRLRGLVRARAFSWEKAARQTLDIFTAVAGS